MSAIDWILCLVIVIAALIQLYFGSRYREIFEIDSKKINKSYFVQIRELNDKYPIAGRVYMALMAIQLFGFVTLIIRDKLQG